MKAFLSGLVGFPFYRSMEDIVALHCRKSQRFKDQTVGLPVSQRMEDMVPVISQGSSSQRIEDQTMDTHSRSTEIGRYHGGDTTLTSATSSASANQQGEAKKKRVVVVGDDDVLLSAAPALANEMNEQLLQNMEQRWQNAHDCGCLLSIGTVVARGSSRRRKVHL